VDAVRHHRPEVVVLVTPNNPTGHLIQKSKLLELHDRTTAEGPVLLIDESFLDFAADGPDQSLLAELSSYPRVLVFRSMSKTFGIGGLRLGFAASADQALLSAFRAEIPIWNINGFAEEFVLCLPQYRPDYAASCTLVRQETDRLVAGLQRIPALDVLQTQANFILCRVMPSHGSAESLAQRLVDEHGIYVKDCGGKVMPDASQYVRISSRDPEANATLLQALDAILGSVVTIDQSELQLAS
jgi:threonine-phosphate decarboxylase